MAKHVVGEWTYPGDHDRTQATALLRSSPFVDAPFLVERATMHSQGCPCCTRIEYQLGIYPGRAVAVMLNNPTRWKIKRYGIIDVNNG